MTADRRDRNESPFADWLRGEPRLDSIHARLSVTDCDYWIHQYRSHHDRAGECAIDSILMIELKVNNATPKNAQRDTLRLINQCFRRCFYTADMQVRTMMTTIDGEVRKVRCYGNYVLVLSKTRPDEPGCVIRWNDRQITRRMLTEILAFRRDPNTLNLHAWCRQTVPDAMPMYQTIKPLAQVANLAKRN